LGGTPGPVNPGGDAYVASRDEASGWTTASTSPAVGIIRGWAGGATALSFTPDFSRWFQLGGTQTQYQLGIGQAFQGGLGGLFSPLSPLLVPLVGGEKSVVQQAGFQGAPRDHTRLYFIPGTPATAYLPGDPEPSGATADHNTYIAQLDSGGQPSLQLLARDRSGKVWGGSCGTRLGGVREVPPASGPTGGRNQGAISPHG